MGFIAVYITHESNAQARPIIETLLAEKAIACANVFPMESAYWWKGSVAREGEIVTLVKSRTENWPYLQRRIEEIHPYEVPCVVRFEVEANPAYEAWIREVTRPLPA